MGLEVDEIDIYHGGSSHDLLNPEAQAKIEQNIMDGKYDFVIVLPPCASWSRATYNPPPGVKPDKRYPSPCRSKEHPWGLPDAKPSTKRRSEQGNAFIHFALRALEATASVWRERKQVVRVLLEHPEDLGRTRTGKNPVSIWQLEELRTIIDKNGYVTVVGHQCQFGVD